MSTPAPIMTRTSSWWALRGDKGGYFDQRLVTTVNLVEEPLRGDTWHRLLACRIDGQENSAVGDGERRGKAIDQVVGATV